MNCDQVVDFNMFNFITLMNKAEGIIFTFKPFALDKKWSYAKIGANNHVVEVAEKKYNGEKTSIRLLLTEKINAPAKDLFSTGIHEGLKTASIALEKLVSDVSNLTLRNLFDNIIREAGVLSTVMQSLTNWQLQVLTYLADFVKKKHTATLF
jgi:hypothetical protein